MMFLSFCLFGSVPLVFYLVAHLIGSIDGSFLFPIACAATAITLFALGVLKGAITNHSKLWSGCVMLVNGTVAASVSYFLGMAMTAMVGSGGGS